MLREANKQETREAIIDAAERLLDRYGYAKMTMTDLADEAAIGVGTTYLYFPGKVEVALAVLERLTSRVRTELQKIAALPTPPEQRLREMLTARIMLRYDSARTRRHQIDDFKRAVQSSVDRCRAGWLRQEAEILAAIIREGQHAGTFQGDDADGIAEMLMLAMSGMTPKNLSQHDFEDAATFRDKTERMVSLFLDGLLARDQV